MFTLLLVLIYTAFISLGLPDSILGAAWPTMQTSLHVPTGWGGILSFLITCGTIVSSLFSGRLIRHFSTGTLVLCSVTCTAIALFGFSCSTQYWQLCIWTIPYGLGAGAVDEQSTGLQARPNGIHNASLTFHAGIHGGARRLKRAKAQLMRRKSAMSMTEPNILQLLEKADCRYTLVVEVSKRARQLVDGVPPLIDARDKENMPVSIAIDEVNRGLITYERGAQADAR